MLETIPFTSVHSNLEHGLAILTESFSPLRSAYTTSLIEVQSRSDAVKPSYSYLVTCTTTRSGWFDLV